MQAHRAKRRETALITGASSGIGAALARRFAQGHYDLVLVARRADRLRAIARALEADYAIRVRVASLDLLRPGSAERLANSMKRRRVRIDVLVNNAGIVEVGPFTRMPAARSQRIIALNVAATTALLSRFLPPMARRGRGRVLNVCSVASFLPVPTLATYAATKAYLLSLSGSLAEELDGTGVTVTGIGAAEGGGGTAAVEAGAGYFPGLLEASKTVSRWFAAGGAVATSAWDWVKQKVSAGCNANINWRPFMHRLLTCTSKRNVVRRC